MRTKARICAALGWACFFLLLCIVGGTERGWLPVSRLWWSPVLTGAWAALLWKAGWIRG